MPATEKTGYNQKALHVVFAFSSLGMLIATVWMFAADHGRQWKSYQDRARTAERRLSQWRLADANSRENQQKREAIEAELRRVRSQAPLKSQIEAFQTEVQTDEQQRRDIEEPEPSGDVDSYDFSKIFDRYDQLVKLASAADELRPNAEAASSALGEARQQLAAAQSALNSAKSTESDAGAIAELNDAKDEAMTAEREAREAADEATSRLAAAEDDAIDVREKILDELADILGGARLREDILLRDRKLAAARYDAAKSDQTLLVRDGKLDQLPGAQKVIDRVKADLDRLTLRRQDATAHRESLQSTLREITATEDGLEKQLAENQADADQLLAAIDERQSTFLTWTPPFVGKKWLELPILDAFNSPLKIDNLWTENLTQPVGSFGQVRRFDRCTTCHQMIDTAMPGSAVEPAYIPQHDVRLTLFTPDFAPGPEIGEDGKLEPVVTLEQVYGIRLAARGLVNDDDIAISHVTRDGLAAEAIVQVEDGQEVGNGFRVGDVLLSVNDEPLGSVSDAQRLLLETVEWGQPVTVTVSRGLPLPFTSHPRLDLFVGSLSPHKLSVVGCTVCHEGQGSATEFKWCSHAPNDPQQAEKWRQDHGWFKNHHWIYPMFPKRFMESACLKCHHDVTELDASEQFPDAPAPKLIEGFALVKRFGCYGCHEISGYDGPDSRVGPDLRLEPNFSEIAAAVKADPKIANVPDQQKEWIESLILHPEYDDVRRELQAWLSADETAEQPVLSRDSHALADALKDVETPGKMRKAGPSLRYVANKVGEPFVYEWVRRPKDFRPTTDMPQFFGHWDHLEGHDLDLTKKLEPVEILGITRYLLTKSQPFEYLPPAENIQGGSPEEQAERGKVLFETRGCLACHRHEDFPGATSTYAPDLSGMGDKLAESAGAPNGRAWLYTWIKSPTHYHARSTMPDLFLDPITDAEGNTTDPAADIAEYLLSSSTGWKPQEDSAESLVDPAMLDKLVLENLSQAFFSRKAEQYLQTGIPESLRDSLKGGEVELVGPIDEQKKLLYLGRKAIVKYGCHGCHDIPGFETAKTIGTSLADWGRKDPSKLAFESILEYVSHGAHGHGHVEAVDAEASAGRDHDAEHDVSSDEESSVEDDDIDAGNPDGEEPFDDSYYVQQLEEHDRIGFIWQKLTEPRSYDFERTANKRYDERLRMPLFPLNAGQREAIVTFVLGLVAEPPADEFVYHPDQRQDALNEGRSIIEKYNCSGCHLLEFDKWDLEYEPGDIEAQPEVQDYPFVMAHLPSDEVERSATPDPNRGTIRSTITGLAAIDSETGKQMVWDEEGEPLEEEFADEYDETLFLYPFVLWEPAALDGVVHQVGVRDVFVPAYTIRRQTQGWGGALTRMLLPRVVELETESSGSEAWGWLPPILAGQGAKVQPEWLHAFLLDPHPIRPAVFMRMPRFNMSSDEATKLVNFFAARSNIEYPYEFESRKRETYLATADEAFRQRAGTDGASRLDQAMQVVTNANYCIKCHVVGDFEPGGSDRAKAPDLSAVHARLRPEYIRKWIASPKKVLSYTAMPVNVPYDPDAPNLGGIDQALYPGTSIEQVDALVDLLMNFPVYTRSKSKIAELVEQAGGVATDAEATSDQPDEAPDEAASSDAAAAKVDTANAAT